MVGAQMARQVRRPNRPDGNRRCLIVERHTWETGGNQQQLQFVLEPTRAFFGPGGANRRITVRLFIPSTAAEPTLVRQVIISREYANGTRRTNSFPEMGGMPSSFVFFEETDQDDVYDVWWQVDKAIVAARFTEWTQGRGTQYGRGRLSVIVAAPVPRLIERL